MVFCVQPKFDLWWNWESPKGLSASPLPTLQPWIRSLRQIALPPHRDRPSAFSSLRSGLQGLAGLWNYSKKPTTSFHGGQGHPILLSLPSLFNSACLFILPEGTLCGPVWRVVSPPPDGVCVTMTCCLSRLPSIRSWVLGRSQNPTAGPLSSAVWSRGKQTLLNVVL